MTANSIDATPRVAGDSVNAKLCAGPSSGGSGRGCVRYILGYELGAHAKDDQATPEQRHEAFHNLLQESLARDDCGVGVIWQPQVGDGTRPSSVYAKNVTSLATADMEMDALGAVAKSHRVREPMLHFVFSINPDESRTTSDDQIIRAAERALQKIDLGGNAQIHAVHRDTDHAHVHVAVAAVNASTLRSWERSRNYYRLSWAVREVELEMGMPHDRGLAVVREDEQGHKRVEWASRTELLAWARERTEERLEEQARKYAHDYLAFEDPRSWASDVVVPRLREYVEEAQARGEALRWSEMHLIAAQSAVRLERDPASGALLIRVMEREREGRVEGRERTLDGFGEPLPSRERLQRESDAPAMVIATDDLIGPTPGSEERVERHREHEQRRVFVEERFRNATEAEREFIAGVERDPGLVSRAIVANGQAVFSRSDLDRYLAERISDADELAQVSQQVEQRDGSLRMLSADTEHPLYTTAGQLTLEERVAAKATSLARERDPRFDRAMLDRAIDEIEHERGIVLSAEQRRVLDGLEYRLSWVQGDAGTGKTRIMEVANRYATLTDRPIVGFTTAQAAAQQLQDQSGAFALNSVRALTYEEHAGRRIVEDHAITMFDETSMLEMTAFDKTLNLVRDRDAIVIGIGDAAQLPAIAAGDTHRLMCEITKRDGHYVELQEVRRQRDDLAWMRPVVRDLGRAIREGDQDGVVRNIDTMAQRGTFEFSVDRAGTLRAAANAYIGARREGRGVVLNCDNRLDARHLNWEIRQRLELSGGTAFKTSQGVAEATVGDRIAFLRNNKTIGVLNGYTATIESVQRHRTRWQITARLDDGHLVRWNPDRYRDWTYGHAVTTHKAQGQSVSTDLYVMTHQLQDARLAHAGWTRGESALRVFVSREAYADARELGQSLAERTTPKADAILYRELEQRYGGPQTHWAINVRRAMADHTDPLRQEYVREQRALEARRTAALRGVSEQYARKFAKATDPGQKKSIEREHRAASKRALEKYKAQTFVQWAGERRRAETIERDGNRLEQTTKIRQEQQIQRKRRPMSRDEQLRRQIELVPNRNDHQQTTSIARERDLQQER